MTIKENKKSVIEVSVWVIETFITILSCSNLALFFKENPKKISLSIFRFSLHYIFTALAVQYAYPELSLQFAIFKFFTQLIEVTAFCIRKSTRPNQALHLGLSSCLMYLITIKQRPKFDFRLPQPATSTIFVSIF